MLFNEEALQRFDEKGSQSSSTWEKRTELVEELLEGVLVADGAGDEGLGLVRPQQSAEGGHQRRNQFRIVDDVRSQHHVGVQPTVGAAAVVALAERQPIQGTHRHLLDHGHQSINRRWRSLQKGAQGRRRRRTRVWAELRRTLWRSASNTLGWKSVSVVERGRQPLAHTRPTRPEPEPSSTTRLSSTNCGSASSRSAR